MYPFQLHSPAGRNRSGSRSCGRRFCREARTQTTNYDAKKEKENASSALPNDGKTWLLSVAKLGAG